MNLYSENENYKLYKGNMLDMLEVIQPETIDSIITDPPYGLTSITKRFGKENSAECQYGKDGSFQRLSKGFMGKEWDGSGIEYNVEAWKKCYEVLKPGGYLLAFGGSRTFHRIACAIEDAGFEIRDTIMWLYGSGFPKSMNVGLKMDKKQGCPDRGHRIAVANRHHPDGTLEPNGEVLEPYEAKTDLGKQWQGWGTALKPSFEPIIVARKPFKGSLVDNVIEYGVGGINIDECRVGTETISIHNAPKGTFAGGEYNRGSDTESYRESQGRFPANTILTYDETDFDEVCGGFPNTKGDSRTSKPTYDKSIWGNAKSVESKCLYNDSGSASRYFYCAKASKKDRDEGLDEFEDKEYILGCNGATLDNIREKGHYGNGGNGLSSIKIRKNTHPTVKPTELMQYLIRLVTPNNGTILDCFNGSGSTGKAVMYENYERNKNYKYIGIELTEEYLPISKARIEYVCNLEPEINPQMSIFDMEV